jgi:RNA polymerase sigma factor (sigma-70 family)
MKRRGPPSLLEIANRLIEAQSKSYFGAFGGAVPLDELRSFAGVGAAEALRKWNGHGVFDAFAAQRIRWAILRLVRRQILRHLPESGRDEACAAVAAERVADTYDAGPEEASLPLPSVQELVDEAAWAYRLELARADEELTELADPADDVERTAERMKVRRAIGRLPPPENLVIERHVYEGETIAEIAEGLVMSRSTVHDAYRRGVQRLVDMLSPTSALESAPALLPSPA